MKKRRIPSQVRVGRSSAGLGLFATQPIAKGDFVIEYTGEKISSDEADRRGGKYLFTLTKDVVIDGTGRENTARYINHACKPNCEAEVDEDDMKVRIYARRNIASGEELTYHYGKEYWDDHIKPHGCRCAQCAR
ncbi:SET domain-containing protein-lysine N-methyltransferase [Candidatus Kaiserbacteria bacterium]|nr:SET domain-containing protein-lysine N-methyltransferase [Candidatus Kaiserbacteria bacterium]